jgi:glycosyltransferase involved in cell wall biosynthesis
MRIISIGLYNPIPIKSGVDSYVTSLLNPLGRKNDVIHYYFFQSHDEKGHYSKERNFQSEYLKSDIGKKILEKRKFVQLLRPELLINKDPLKNITADLVLCDTFTFQAGRYVSKRNDSPIVLIKHNIEWKYLQNIGSYAYIFLKAYEHYILRKADAVITISKSDYHYFTKYIGEERIYYIPPKVNTDIFKPDGLSYDFGIDKFNLLFYGSLDRPMNIEALEFINHRLIPLLKKMDLLDKIRVNIFGSGIPPKYLKLSEDKNINYLGSVDDPGRYIRGADLVIIPVTNPGGMKIRILELLLCGKPAIVTPEASIGLPNEFKEFVCIEKDAEGFLRTIKLFLDGTLVKKIDTAVIEDYMNKSRTMCDVIDDLFALKKK